MTSSHQFVSSPRCQRGTVVAAPPVTSQSQALVSIINYLQTVPNPREALRQNALPFCIALGIPVTHNDSDSLVQALEMVLNQVMGSRFLDATTFLSSADRQRSSAPFSYLHGAPPPPSTGSMVSDHMMYAYAASMGPQALLPHTSAASSSLAAVAAADLGYHSHLASQQSLLPHEAYSPHSSSGAPSSLFSVPSNGSVVLPCHFSSSSSLQLGNSFHHPSSLSTTHFSGGVLSTAATASASTSCLANPGTPIGLGNSCSVSASDRRHASSSDSERTEAYQHTSLHISRTSPTRQTRCGSAAHHAQQQQPPVTSPTSQGSILPQALSDSTCTEREPYTDKSKVCSLLGMPSKATCPGSINATTVRCFSSDDNQQNMSNVSGPPFLLMNADHRSTRSDPTELPSDSSTAVPEGVIHPCINTNLGSHGHPPSCATPSALPPRPQHSSNSSASGIVRDVSDQAPYSRPMFKPPPTSSTDVPSTRSCCALSTTEQVPTSRGCSKVPCKQESACYRGDSWTSDASTSIKSDNDSALSCDRQNTASVSSTPDVTQNGTTADAPQEIHEMAASQTKGSLIKPAEPTSRPRSHSSPLLGRTVSDDSGVVKLSSGQRPLQKCTPSAPTFPRCCAPGNIELQLDALVEELTLEEKVQFAQAISNCSSAFLDVHTSLRNVTRRAARQFRKNEPSQLLDMVEPQSPGFAEHDVPVEKPTQGESRSDAQGQQATTSQLDALPEATGNLQNEALQCSSYLKDEAQGADSIALKSSDAVTAHQESKKQRSQIESFCRQNVESATSGTRPLLFARERLGDEHQSCLSLQTTFMALLDRLKESTLAFFTSCPSKVFVYFAISVLQDFPLFQSTFQTARRLEACCCHGNQSGLTKAFLREALFGDDKRFCQPSLEAPQHDTFCCCGCCASSESQSDSPSMWRRHPSTRCWGVSESCRSRSSSCSTASPSLLHHRGLKRQRPSAINSSISAPPRSQDAGGGAANYPRTSSDVSPQYFASAAHHGCSQNITHSGAREHADDAESGAQTASQLSEADISFSKHAMAGNNCSDNTEALFAENQLLHRIPPHLYRDIPPRSSKQARWDEKAKSAGSSSSGQSSKPASAPTSSVFGPMPKHISPKDEMLLQMPEHIITKTGVILPPSDSRLYLSKVVGVVWDKIHNSWVVNYTLLGRRYFQHFPAKKYGFLEGRQLAIELRLAKDREKSLVEGTVRGGGRRAQGPRHDSRHHSVAAGTSLTAVELSSPAKSTRHHRRAGRTDTHLTLQESALLQQQSTARLTASPHQVTQEPSLNSHASGGPSSPISCHETDSVPSMSAALESLQHHNYHTATAENRAGTNGSLRSLQLQPNTTLHPLPQTVGSASAAHSATVHHHLPPSSCHIQHLQHLHQVAAAAAAASRTPSSISTTPNNTTDMPHHQTSLHSQQLLHPRQSVPLNHATVSFEQHSNNYASEPPYLQHSYPSSQQSSLTALMQASVQTGELVHSSMMPLSTDALGVTLDAECQQHSTSFRADRDSADNGDDGSDKAIIPQYSIPAVNIKMDEATTTHHPIVIPSALSTTNNIKTSSALTTGSTASTTLTASPPTSPSTTTSLGKTPESFPVSLGALGSPVEKESLTSTLSQAFESNVAQLEPPIAKSASAAQVNGLCANRKLRPDESFISNVAESETKAPLAFNLHGSPCEERVGSNGLPTEENTAVPLPSLCKTSTIPFTAEYHRVPFCSKPTTNDTLTPSLPAGRLVDRVTPILVSSQAVSYSRCHPLARHNSGAGSPPQPHPSSTPLASHCCLPQLHSSADHSNRSFQK